MSLLDIEAVITIENTGSAIMNVVRILMIYQESSIHHLTAKYL